MFSLRKQYPNEVITHLQLSLRTAARTPLRPSAQLSPRHVTTRSSRPSLLPPKRRHATIAVYVLNSDNVDVTQNVVHLELLHAELRGDAMVGDQVEEEPEVSLTWSTSTMRTMMVSHP
jgi:hypothetical protein